jgi:4-amino-4-deoxy-L-arabinose transferase-like glycosyltransferase
MWLAWAAVIALYVGLRVPLLAVPLERDEGAFAAIGAAILRGEVPYRDIFDHKPPGAFYLYALALLAVPRTAVGVHLFLLVWSLGTLLGLASLARVLGGERAALWSAVAFCIVALAPSVQGFSASSESLLLLPLVASLRVTVAGTAAGGRWSMLALAGVLGAAACWIKQPAGLPLLATLVLLHDRCERGRVLPALAAWLGGALVLGIVVVTYFVAASGWRELWYWTVEHSGLYAAVPVSRAAARAVAGFTNLLRDMPLFIAAAVIGVPMSLSAQRGSARFALAFLFLSAAAVFHSGFFYLHYFALVVPAVCLAGGLGLAWLQEHVERSGGLPRPVFAAAVLVLAFVPPVAARRWYWFCSEPAAVVDRLLGAQGADASELLAAYIRERSSPDARIFVYGSEPQIGFLSGRRDLNPFVMIYPMTWDWPRHREFQERAWRAIAQAPPTYLVIARLPNSLVRSDAVDTFLEERLLDLGRREYHFEAAALSDGTGVHLSMTPPDANGQQVVSELWRRNQ